MCMCVSIQKLKFIIKVASTIRIYAYKGHFSLCKYMWVCVCGVSKKRYCSWYFNQFNLTAEQNY